MDATWFVLPIVAALALAVGYLIHKTSSDRRIGGAEREAKRIVETAERDAELALAERALELSVFGSDAAGSGPIRLGGTWDVPHVDGTGDG